MDIITWEPKDSEKVEKLYMNYKYPEGVKVIDEWFDLTGYRMFVIYEIEDEKAYAASVFPFMGTCRFETFPVMKSDKFMQLDRKLIEEARGKEFIAGQSEETTEEVLQQMEKLEKRVQRLEHHSFIKQEDTT
ncbi:MAG TPA: DUF3303 family protein [Methanosarcina sp.]|nr:DUF3303 family protein [Methanosarcina sp.]